MKNTPIAYLTDEEIRERMGAPATRAEAYVMRRLLEDAGFAYRTPADVPDALWFELVRAAVGAPRVHVMI